MLALCAQSAAAGGYTFEALADSSELLARYSFSAPVLNDAGVAAFIALLAAGLLVIGWRFAKPRDGSVLTRVC